MSTATAVKVKGAKNNGASSPVFGGKITIPAGCKPSKVCSPDRTCPILQHAYLRRRTDGTYWLLVTDAYTAVALKVEAEGQPADGYIPIGALRLMERGQDAEQIGTYAWKVDTPDGAVTFDIESVMRGSKDYPSFEQYGLWDPLKVDDEALKVIKGAPFAVGINPDLMKKIADGLGANGFGCRFEISAPLKPIRVTPLQGFGDRIGLQMPIRLNV